MILCDNETKIDQLNNLAIAKTVTTIINESETSLSIGIHGDWGAGKSSVLAMVESELNSDCVDNTEKDEDTWEELLKLDNAEEMVTDEESAMTVVVRFNSWQYQGFEDAKIALMSAIVSALQRAAKAHIKKHPVKGVVQKIQETCKNIWGNIDKLSLAKNVSKIGVSFATGTMPISIIEMILNHFKDTITDGDKVSDLIGKIGEVMKTDSDETDTLSYKEMAEFRSNFKVLFAEAHIKKLVVLIDDLDRCLPKVAIETLEAVRMFLSMENTAFVIAADDLMIRYSVKEYFPRIIEQATDNADSMSKIDYNRFADKYLEKLIQIPIHIPRIGILEAQLYIMLLMIESKLGRSKEMKALDDIVINRLHKPWAIEQLTSDEIKSALGNEYDSVVKQVMIAKSIDRILAENTNGNPRNIKRFINMLLLRTEIANNRGFGSDDMDMAVLAKMMLIEQYNNDFYKALAAELNEDGIYEDFEYLVEDDDDSVEDKKASNKDEAVEKQNDTKKPASKTELETEREHKGNDSSFLDYFDHDEIKAWMETKPSLVNIDLRPYYFICKEKQDFFFCSQEERLHELVAVIRGGKFNVAKKSNEIKQLSVDDAKRLFNICSQAALTINLSTEKAPKIIEGLKAFVKFRQELRNALADFLLTLPLETLGVWAVGGWDECIPKTDPSRTKLDEFYILLEKKSTNPFVVNAIRKSRGDN